MNILFSNFLINLLYENKDDIRLLLRLRNI
jgi:hypothetical protein